MRRLLLGIAIVMLVACSSSDSTTGPSSTTGTVVFKLDANSCGTGSGVITFYIDGTSVGSATIAGGQSSPSYTTSAGQHGLSARVANTGYTWPTLNATVPAGGTYTYLMLCS
jgi:hypothetical protein